VPFVHPDGRSVLAFNASANVAHHTPMRMARTGRRLLDLSDEVRRQLAAGGRGPSLGRA
jgi:DNA-binding IclR family transcriptional regulator